MQPPQPPQPPAELTPFGPRYYMPYGVPYIDPSTAVWGPSATHIPHIQPLISSRDNEGRKLEYEMKSAEYSWRDKDMQLYHQRLKAIVEWLNSIHRNAYDEIALFLSVYMPQKDRDFHQFSFETLDYVKQILPDNQVAVPTTVPPAYVPFAKGSSEFNQIREYLIELDSLDYPLRTKGRCIEKANHEADVNRIMHDLCTFITSRGKDVLSEVRNVILHPTYDFPDGFDFYLNRHMLERFYPRISYPPEEVNLSLPSFAPGPAMDAAFYNHNRQRYLATLNAHYNPYRH